MESKILQKWTNRVRDIENRLVFAKAAVGGRGLDWEFGIFLLQTGAYRLDRQQGPIV